MLIFHQINSPSSTYNRCVCNSFVYYSSTNNHVIDTFITKDHFCFITVKPHNIHVQLCCYICDITQKFYNTFYTWIFLLYYTGIVRSNTLDYKIKVHKYEKKTAFLNDHSIHVVTYYVIFLYRYPRVSFLCQGNFLWLVFDYREICDFVGSKFKALYTRTHVCKIKGKPPRLKIEHYCYHAIKTHINYSVLFAIFDQTRKWSIIIVPITYSIVFFLCVVKMRIISLHPRNTWNDFSAKEFWNTVKKKQDKKMYGNSNWDR